MSLMKKTEKFPKAYWIITVAAIVIAVVLAVFVPVPRAFRQPIGFLTWIILEAVGILGYSLWMKKSNGFMDMGNRRNHTRRGRR